LIAKSRGFNLVATLDILRMWSLTPPLEYFSVVSLLIRVLAYAFEESVEYLKKVESQ
jgi:hypothetical protein